MENIEQPRDIQKKIEEINRTDQDKFIKFNEIIAICTNSLSKLRSMLGSYEFSDKQEEIDFFKKIKPIPLSNLIYYSEIKSLEMNFPRINPKDQRKYILKQTVRLNNFFAEQSEFVQYINLGMTTGTNTTLCENTHFVLSIGIPISIFEILCSTPPMIACTPKFWLFSDWCLILKIWRIIFPR